MKTINSNRIIATACAAVLATAGVALAQNQGAQNDAQQRPGMQQDRMQQNRMGQDRMGQSQMSPEQVKQMEKMFVEAAANTNLFEIESAKLVEGKIDNPQVKQYAQRTMQDHQRNQDQLKQAAQQAGYDVPTSVTDPVKKAELDKLQKLDAGMLAPVYMIGQTAGHKGAVLLFTHAATNCQDQQLKQYARQTLPALQGHYDHAEQITYDLIGASPDSIDGMNNRARTAGGQMGQMGQMGEDMQRQGRDLQREAGNAMDRDGLNLEDTDRDGMDRQPGVVRPRGTDATDIDEGEIRQGLPGARDATNVDPNDAD